MANELDERRKMDRAARARAIIDDPIVVEALTNYETDLIELWATTPATATAEREIIWALIKAGRHFSRTLNTIIGDGRVSQAILADLLGGNHAA